MIGRLGENVEDEEDEEDDLLGRKNAHNGMGGPAYPVDNGRLLYDRCMMFDIWLVDHFY
jgi:hypothetical protein